MSYANSLDPDVYSVSHLDPSSLHVELYGTLVVVGGLRVKLNLESALPLFSCLQPRDHYCPQWLAVLQRTDKTTEYLHLSPLKRSLILQNVHIHVQAIWLRIRHRGVFSASGSDPSSLPPNR